MEREGAAAAPHGRILLILLLAYIFNFVDRQILSILQIPIKAELGLSDAEVGLMGGIAFALLYSTLAIPVARIADRTDRAKIIAVSVGLWSAFTALCGTTQSFWQIFAARMGVGIGEAGGVAPSYALISHHFPPERRARALAIFSLGIPIGSALGVFFGGWLASSIDWRSAFFAVGGAGLLLAPLVWFGIPDPGRGRLERHAAAQAPLATVAGMLLRKPSFWLLSFGAAGGSVVGYGLAFWIPAYLSRSLGLELIGISWFYGSVVLVGGVAGIWLGGWLGDRLARTRPGGYPLVPAVCFLLAAPLYAVGIFATSLPLAWILLTLATALGLVWLGPVVAAVQHIVPPEMRATASAAFLFINNLIGIGFGIWIMGRLSDLMAAAHGADSLRYSMLTVLSFYLLSSALYFGASRTVARDWHG
ncbi:MAG TPA: MFS transporter [Allosphingosinicella sp.]|jgi:predicted MFS family arabinose efflux permease